VRDTRRQLPDGGQFLALEQTPLEFPFSVMSISEDQQIGGPRDWIGDQVDVVEFPLPVLQ